MKIAILANQWIPLPPTGAGGTERVIYELQEGLTKKNHNVTVFATGDSKIQAHLAYHYENALGSSSELTYNPYYYMQHVYGFMQFLKDKHFDVIHFNDAGRFSLYFSDYLHTPFVTTLHGSYNPVDNDPFGYQSEKRAHLRHFKNTPFISISNAQRASMPELNYIATVYNSLIIENFPFQSASSDYIAWIGRVNEEKGIDIGMQVAQALKRKMVTYGFIDGPKQAYFDETIKPLLVPGQIEFHGETSSNQQKASFLGNAKLFLMPIRWDEPFGIVLAEAMACGTPVVAFAKGAVPEIIKDGITGFIVNPSNDDIRGDFVIKKTGIEGLCEAVERIYAMQAQSYAAMRKVCREHVERTFTIERMVTGYESAYQMVMA